MKLTVTGRHLEIPPAVRQQLDTKLARLDRLMNDSAVSAQCVLSRERGMFVCELTVHAREDHTLHGLGRHAQLPRVLSLAVDKVFQQAQRLKDRWKTRRRVNGTSHDVRASADDAAPPEPRPRVIRARRSAVKPMRLEDAVLCLTEGRGAFLVFRDASSDGVNILYRRQDGNLGLIEPEL